MSKYFIFQKDDNGNLPNESDYIFEQHEVDRWLLDGTLKDGDLVLEIDIKNRYNIDISETRIIQMKKI